MIRRDPEEVRALSDKALRKVVLDDIARGAPTVGPHNVHIDVINGCNAACVTCWDHSPHLETPRPAEWKRKRMSWEHFSALCDQLAALGSVRAVVLSGMGEPLIHPRIYDMIARVKAEGWHLTLLSNLVAADADRLASSGVDTILVGVQGVTPGSYTAFHPGWTEQHFFTMCRYLRRLSRAGVRTKHVQVINRDTAPEVVEMVRFGRLFRADRVNFKLASLYGGTEAVSISEAQRDHLLDVDLPRARALAVELGVNTNLHLFTEQVRAAREDIRHTVPIEQIGCFMGHVYTRITVTGEVLYCCNTEVQVAHLDDAPLDQLWFGEAWQGWRERIAGGDFVKGCDKCGKFEQNRKWSERVGFQAPGATGRETETA